MHVSVLSHIDVIICVSDLFLYNQFVSIYLCINVCMKWVVRSNILTINNNYCLTDCDYSLGVCLCVLMAKKMP